MTETTRPETAGAVEHTPGPWRVMTPSDGSKVIVSAATGSHIAEIAHWNARKEPNARLIAAAPELLEALRAIADESVFNQQRYAEDTDADYFLRCFRAVKERARSALAHDTGQEKNDG